jgi:uncharacterized protein
MQIRTASFAWILPLLYWPLAALATGSAFAQVADNEPGAPPPFQIGVILPLQSSTFAKHAEAVRLGVFAAAEQAADGPKVRIFSTTDEADQVVEAHRKAVSMGARLIIGPLTRSAVTALAYSGAPSVPTIALSSPEGDIFLPRNLYVFGLQIEAEVRQVANWAYRKGGNRVFLLGSDSPLANRISLAFENEWKNLRGEVVGRYGYTTDRISLSQLRGQVTASRADVIFTALGAEHARFLRPHLGKSIQVYATSQVYASAADAASNFDLDGVRFLDMPWLLQPDHPAVISYLRNDSATWDPDFERLYALGIDAYRIAVELLRPRKSAESLDGVTGTIRIGANSQIERLLVPAEYSQGVVRPLEPSATQ